MASWATKDLFAGTCEPVGAEDGWYLMALLLEEARIQGIPITGGSADLWKCLDQIQIAFLCKLIRLAGYPTGPLTAYSNFHQHCLYYNTLAGGLGLSHYHPSAFHRDVPSA